MDDEPQGDVLFERDLAVRELKQAEAGLKVAQMALNDNRPLEALYTINNELDRLDENLDHFEEMDEARQAAEEGEMDG